MIKRICHLFSPKFQNLFLEYQVHFKPRYGHGLPAHPELYSIINKQRDNYIDLLHKALAFKEVFWQIQEQKKETDPAKPGWNNGYLPGLDIIGIYTMLATLKPARYIEIGSGNSTKVAYKAKKEQGLDTEITSIDPAPQAEIDDLADKIIRQPFENIDSAF